MEFWIEKIIVGSQSRIVGQTIGDSHIGNDTGTLFLAIVRPNGTSSANPRAAAMIEAVDTLLEIGTRQQLRHLSEITAGARGNRGQQGALCRPVVSRTGWV